jgi:hypothetical protein
LWLLMPDADRTGAAGGHSYDVDAAFMLLGKHSGIT